MHVVLRSIGFYGIVILQIVSYANYGSSVTRYISNSASPRLYQSNMWPERNNNTIFNRNEAW